MNAEFIMRFLSQIGGSLSLALLLSIGSAAPGQAADETLRPGKWEIITTGSMDQSGQKMEIPETRSEMCVAPAQDQASSIPADNTCQIETLEKAAGKMVTRATCGEIVTESTMTWNDDSYESVSHMEMTSGGQVIMVNDTRVVGRYLGACS